MHRISRAQRTFVVLVVSAVVCSCLTESRYVRNDQKGDAGHFDQNTFSNSKVDSSAFRTVVRRPSRRSEADSVDDNLLRRLEESPAEAGYERRQSAGRTRHRRDAEHPPVDSTDAKSMKLESFLLPPNEKLLKGSEDEMEDFYDEMIPALKSSKNRYRLNPRLRDIVLVSERPPDKTNDDDELQLDKDEYDDVTEHRTDGTSCRRDRGDGELVDTGDGEERKRDPSLFAVGQDRADETNGDVQ